MKLFCDMDGTLVDVAPRHYKVYSEAVRLHGGVSMDQKSYWDMKRKKTKWKDLLIASALPPKIEEDFLRYFIDTIESQEYLAIDQLFEGVYETLYAFSEKHDLYLVSLRRNENNLLRQLDDLNIRELFTQVLSGHSNSDGYDKKIELISSVKGNDNGMIIGDTEADIVTGKQLGLYTAAVTSGIRDEAYLEALEPDYLLRNFNELREVSKF